MKRVCTFFIILIALSCWTSVADAQTVRMPDANLAAVVRDALGLGSNAAITKQRIQGLTRLDARDSQIKNLTGLEHATQLTHLFLYYNQIRDVSPLRGLTRLRHLGLDGNQISNVRPLIGLKQLELLHIGQNKINNSGVQLLSNLTELKWLSLHVNQISNITPLAKLKKLEGLWIGGNTIRDVSPLAGLVNLETLHLGGNPIQDTSPLASLTKLRDVDIEISQAVTGAGPKIEGPWLWTIVPTGGSGGRAAALSGRDWLATASGGAVREQQIATRGAIAGAAVGNKAWTPGKLAPTGGDNITQMVNAIGLGTGDIDNHVAYGSIAFHSPRQQNTQLYVGSDDAVKVWLNGVLVHNNPIDRASSNYQDAFPVTLKQGKNILLVAVYEQAGEWSGFFGFEKDAVYSLVITPVVQVGASAGPKIEGPWLWTIVPTGGSGGRAAALSGRDWLATASGGAVREQQIATRGAIAGAAVGNKAWTPGKLAPTGGDNITQMVNAIGLGTGDIDNHVAYGSIAFHSPRQQNTQLYVGSDDAVKVWLNGVLVHSNPIDRASSNYQDAFPVTLKQGKNILLVAVYEETVLWSGFFGFEKDAVYSLVITPVVQVGASERPPMYWINVNSGTLHRLVGAEVENLVPECP